MGATAEGVIGVMGEVDAAGVGVAGLKLLLYVGIFCLNCAGSRAACGLGHWAPQVASWPAGLLPGKLGLKASQRWGYR